MSRQTARVKISRFLFTNKGDWFSAHCVGDLLGLHRGYASRLLYKLAKDKSSKVHGRKSYLNTNHRVDVYSFQEGA